MGGTASATLSATAQPAAADTVKIGATTYKFVAALTGAANEVLIGGTLAATLNNLAEAVNGGSGAGTDFGVGTAANASATAKAGPTSVVFTAKAAGVGAAGQETGDLHGYAGGRTLASGRRRNKQIAARSAIQVEATLIRGIQGIGQACGQKCRG